MDLDRNNSPELLNSPRLADYEYPKKRYNGGSEYLYYKIINNDMSLSEVKDFVSDDNIHMNRFNNGDLWNPMHAAAYAGRTDIIQYLLSRGAKLNTFDECGDSILFKCAYKKNYRTMDFLISHGEKIGPDSLGYARGRGHLKMLEYFFDNGAICYQPRDQKSFGGRMILNRWKEQCVEYSNRFNDLIRLKCCGPEVSLYLVESVMYN